MIPPAAQAVADVRVLRVADYDGIEDKSEVNAIKKQLLPEAKVEMNLRAPPAAAGGDRRVARARQARAGDLRASSARARRG